MQQSGLVAGYQLDGWGGGEEFDWDQIAASRADKDVLWVHLDMNSPDGRHGGNC